MDALWPSARVLLLLAVANGSPIVAKRILGDRWNAPLDAGLLLFDGRPVLGPSKTVRGLVVAVLCTAIAATSLGLPLILGAAVGGLSMLGDALSSFIKRRLGVETSGRATGIDQIPEALVPLLLLRGALHMSGPQIVLITAAFFLLEMPFARLFYKLGLRDRPY